MLPRGRDGHRSVVSTGTCLCTSRPAIAARDGVRPSRRICGTSSLKGTIDVQCVATSCAYARAGSPGCVRADLAAGGAGLRRAGESVRAGFAADAGSLHRQIPRRQQCVGEPDLDARLAQFGGHCGAGTRRPRAGPEPRASHRAGLRSAQDRPQSGPRRSRDADAPHIAADPSVEYVEIDQIMYPTLTPNDTRLSEQWGFGTTASGINVRPAWDTATGTGVVVAVIDTGITSHPDLNANVLPGYDFISDAARARDNNGRDSNAADQGDWRTANQCGTGVAAANSSWHGTHVAGTIAAVTNNSTGVAGTAFNARIVPIRALGLCGGSSSDIADAIVWASGGTVSGVPANANPAEVINMSLGGNGTCSNTYQNAINGAVSRGTTVVVAAGNSNANVANFTPASCANVISVASITSAGARSSFSNFGTTIDISGPGSAILSALNSGTTTPGSASYASYNGTSMAAPHVAGVVALVQSAASRPLTPAAVETLLKNTARPLPGACSGGCGAGIVNAAGAVSQTP
ncbi:S8 family peptidase [Xanthomonas campestris]|nr:S8 family peptidase [Xanthomonas campestris]